jgi:glucosamine kinase
VAKHIYIGVDGGGTKSKLRVEDGEGKLLGQAVAGPANIRLSVIVAWESIYTALNEVLASHGISLNDQQYHFHAGLGLAGCEVDEACQTFLQTPHPFKTLRLFSDAHAACVGAHHAEDGGIIIVGTGVVGYQIYKDKGSKVGGWGFPHDDEGSGAWLGMQATRSTFEWLDHRAEKSPLVEDVFACFNHEIETLVSFANSATSSDFARLAPLVINHSQQEEIAAVRLMKKAAHAVDRIHHALAKIRQDDHAAFPICLFGGIAPFLEPWLSDALRTSLVHRQADATLGAILLMREDAKKKVAEPC